MEQTQLCTMCEPPTQALLDMPIHRVHAYNLDIWSDIALPEFMEGRGGVDVVIVLESEDAEVECTAAKWNFGAEVTCQFPKIGKFRVRAGREIRVTPVPGADTQLIRLYVEGMMMAVLLHQRDLHVLHASVVEIQGRAAAFVGHIGAGKSTLALALEMRGNRFVADDNAAIDDIGVKPVVIPAFPRVKVYPAIAETLGVAGADLTALHATQVKKTRLVSGHFSPVPVPLDRVYVLSKEAEPGIQRLPPPEAFIELVKNSVPTRWGIAGGREQMANVSALLRTLPVYRVRTFDRLEEIAPLAAQIEAHAISSEGRGVCGVMRHGG
jgi:hypothetical protein